MTRLWSEGVAVKVWLNDHDMPMRFRWQGHIHPIQEIANQWRVDLGWWRLRVWRDYYKLVTTTGLLVVIYHDLVNDHWYLQRIFD